MCVNHSNGCWWSIVDGNDDDGGGYKSGIVGSSRGE